MVLLRLLIDSNKLEALLQRKQDYIGYKKLDQGCNMANALFVLASGISVPADMSIYIKAVMYFIGGFGFYWSVCAMYKALKSEYSADLLQQDIENLNEIEHPFSIVAIKDSFNPYPQRFLLYYDNRWGMNLFPNYRTQETEAGNVANILKHLSNELGIPYGMITIKHKGFELRSKYSVSDKKQKVYAHTLYQAEVKDFPELLQADSFTIGDRKYFWWSIDKMEADESIREHNLDVVELVKHYAD